MFDLSLHSQPTITKHLIGDEKVPLLVVDNFANAVDDLINFAGDGCDFKAEKHNFYPGKRLDMPQEYGNAICRHYLPYFYTFFGVSPLKSNDVVRSALAIADTPEKALRPMQMLPHIDTPQPNQFAVVHYLCAKAHGGTSFYQHKKTGYQTITEERLHRYANEVKQEAMRNKIHKNPHYMQGSNNMFTQLYRVDARLNRAIIYPSNMLHSGNVNPILGLSSVPKKGRLTIGSFISFT